MASDLTEILQRIEALERDQTEIARRVANLIRPCLIVEVDYENSLARVESGELDSSWLPIVRGLAGGTIDRDLPEPGEKCLLLSPDGETSAGHIVPGLYSDDRPPPSTKRGESLRIYADGLQFSYDQETHTLRISRKDGLKVALDSTDLEINSDKVTIQNEQCSLIPTISEAMGIIAESKTPTSSGPQLSTDNAAKLPPLKKKLESFG
jgi:phage baseplate assembly protein V